MNTDRVIQLMNMTESERNNPNQGRVYSTEGICPTLTKMDGGGRQPYIVIYERESENNLQHIRILRRGDGGKCL